ncbi:acetyl/propionyl/methylcrotonyl-CoA carboxylase subunit alpha [Allobacillus sp. GCM10007491]|uniref:biotin carboxylase n=2 Tax=Allobacillus TaxID=1400133 RepID=A0A941CTZ0_9BACI|nr:MULTISPECIES: acetyl-CoA carboxylase biotin carboxylase subunit [Allobacillus]MBR7553169.1 acetyl-CoA carboxylase biotin carboxylase subunit [Allobacillus saliphilus]TSJ67265.1 acetyl-CoA carboxylase biotin carboxylase subunit [Allobacillus salarius]
MFQSILIANRGEIASRIIQTCKLLNIKSVAVYSEPDEDSPYVEEADVAYPLGGSRVNESYLNMDKIFEIAKEAEVEAIHPGYGLLSENASFARRCEEEGITFIGPTPEVIEKMGSKLSARTAMEEAGVPIIPGTNTPVETAAAAKEIANEIGYPVMVKASYGGGGIGMEIVQSESDLEKAIESNAHRAEQFFGNGTLFIEKVIEDAHHVEIQVLGDHHGNAVHLFDRECSIQRRHQKVIEEAPSPLLTEETRKEMGEKAVQAVKSLGYRNAGTLEFLVDENQNYYFLEMNTRLQVEHPVTEEITGIDLVEQQIRIASGEELAINQELVQIQGHAIEVRIYAEDPKTFFPSPGTIEDLIIPKEQFIRNDQSIKKGFKITPFYDPMVAKLIVKGKDRAEAISRLETALSMYKIEGIKTNIPLLLKIAANEAFQNGNTQTSFIQEHITNK